MRLVATTEATTSNQRQTYVGHTTFKRVKGLGLGDNKILAVAHIWWT